MPGFAWPVLGLLLGLIFGLMRGKILRRLTAGLTVGLVGGLVFGLIVVLSNTSSAEPPGRLLIGLLFALFLGLFSGLIFGSIGGLVGGLDSAKLEIRMRPNQGIWQSAKNAVILTPLLGLSIGMIIRILSLGTIIGGLFFVDLVVGLFLGLFFGGKAVIQHLILRLLLNANGYIPWNYARFLDHAAERILLRKAGGGYSFIHRLLLDYFAGLDETRETPQNH